MTQFKDMNLKPEILQSLQDLDFQSPTPVQEKIIPEILDSGVDIIGLAQTGTGKTGAFGIPLVQMVDSANSQTQALVMAPTRELTLQISADLQAFAKYLPKIRITAAYGGARIDGQIRELKRGSQIIVATPGRLLDLMKRKKIDISQIKYLVLDEADEMLNFGFKEEIDAILSASPDHKTTLLFSATMSKGVSKIANDYMKKPLEISVGKKNTGAENVEYHFYVVKAKNRYVAMKRIIDINPEMYGIVFCRTRQETRDIAENLIADGVDADAIHGDLSQAQRDQVMKRFKNKSLKILVATDVASRGIDVKDITHVINYNLPDEVEIYTHRSGRTGRAGKKGIAIAIIHVKESRKLERIQKVIGQTFIHKRIPENDEIIESRLRDFVAELKQNDTSVHVPKALWEIAAKELEDTTKEQLLNNLLQKHLSPVLNKNKSAEELNIPFPGFHDLNTASDAQRSGRKQSRGSQKRSSSSGDRSYSDKPSGLGQNTRSKKTGTENERNKYKKSESKDSPRSKTFKKSDDFKTEKRSRKALIKDVSDASRSTKKEPKKPKRETLKKKATVVKEAEPGNQRLFINSGSKFGLTEESLKKFISNETSVNISKLQSVEIMKKFTFFEIAEAKGAQIISKLQDKEMDGRKVSIQSAIPPKN